jgi:hypothetical protein
MMRVVKDLSIAIVSLVGENLLELMLALTRSGCEVIMESYQASYIKTDYNITRHMGHYYELASRDLKLLPPQCDCQHTHKVRDDGDNYPKTLSSRASI